MDLLKSEQTIKREKKEAKNKKIVLTLLIISILLLIFVIVMIFALKENVTKTVGLNVNDVDIQLTENMIIHDENGTNYIALEKIAPYIGYEYLRGGYLEYVEDPTKCYLESSNQIIGFEANSNVIYKTSQNSTTDYEYYNLKNVIIQQYGMLYVSLEDLSVSCNIIYTFSEQTYKIVIYTTDYALTKYATIFTNAGLTIDDNVNNRIAMAYNMIVVSNQSGRKGVTDWNTNSIIGNKYSTILFNEFSQSFIVSNENKFGVISKQGNIIIDLAYENIDIINYSPLLYRAKLNNKVGVINKDGQIVVNMEYDSIGYSSNSSAIQSTTVIKDIDGQDGIVVSKQGKYGIISLETGRTIIDCSVDKIYLKTNTNGQQEYYVEVQNREIDLMSYLDYINTSTVIRN